MFVNSGGRVTIRRQRGVMSLGSLLLIFTGTLLVAVLLAGIVTSFGYFRGYVSEQLAGHARDGATAIGLSLSNAIDGADPVASASLIDAVFDSGRYLSIRYLDLQGAPGGRPCKAVVQPGGSRLVPAPGGPVPAGGRGGGGPGLAAPGQGAGGQRPGAGLS